MVRLRADVALAAHGKPQVPAIAASAIALRGVRGAQKAYMRGSRADRLLAWLVHWQDLEHAKSACLATPLQSPILSYTDARVWSMLGGKAHTHARALAFACRLLSCFLNFYQEKQRVASLHMHNTKDVTCAPARTRYCTASM